MPAIIDTLLRAKDETGDAFKSAMDTAQQFGEIMEKAFEFGREGAVMTQTRESFEFLMDTIDAAPGTLQRMVTSSGGLVSEFELMASTATLLAGASRDMAREMIEASPRLLEIARAAIKLNPALGSVTDLYDDLTRGIKRSSPMIIDNTGLLVKIGPANEAYAASLGKTVEALTAEERSFALLNATMEAGDLLIAQVGGNVESATDSFDRLDANIINLKENLANLNIFGRTYVEWISDAAETLNLIFTAQDQYDQALVEHNEHMIEVAGSYEEYVAEMERAMGVAGSSVPILSEEEFAIRQVEEAMDDAAFAAGLLEESTDDLSVSSAGLGVEMDLVKGSLRELTDQQIFNKIATDLSAESALGLARDMGILDESTFAFLTAQQAIKAQLDATTISASYADAALRSLALAQQLSGAQVGMVAPSAGVIASFFTDEFINSQAMIDARAAIAGRGFAQGGSGVVPPGFENDSYMIGLSSGEEFAVAPRGRSLGGDGGVTIVFSSLVSLADEAEAESKIRPLVEGVFREMLAERM